jgi:hypothetical protein
MKNIFYFSFFLLLLISCNEKKKHKFGRNRENTENKENKENKENSNVYNFSDGFINFPSLGELGSSNVTKNLEISNFKLENGFKITKDKDYIQKDEKFYVVYSFDVTNIGNETIVGFSRGGVVEEEVGGLKSSIIIENIKQNKELFQFISDSRIETHLFNENNDEVFFSEKTPFLVGKKYKCYGTLSLTPRDTESSYDVNWLTKIRNNEYFEPEILIYIKNSGTKSETGKFRESFIHKSNIKLTNLIDFVKKIDSDPNTINLKYKWDYEDILLNNPWNDKMKKNKNKWNINDFDNGFEVVRVMYDLSSKPL